MQLDSRHRATLRFALSALIIGSLAATGTASARAGTATASGTTVEPAEWIHVTPVFPNEPVGVHPMTAQPDGSILIVRDGVRYVLPVGSETPRRLGSAAALSARPAAASTAPSPTPTRTFPGAKRYEYLADGSILAIGAEHGPDPVTVTWYPHDSDRGTALDVWDMNTVVALASSADGRLALSLDGGTWPTWTHRLLMFTRGTPSPVKNIPLNSTVTSVGITPDGQLRYPHGNVVETTTGRLTTDPPEAPTVVPYPGWGFGFDYARITWDVIPGSHPAVPLTYPVDEQRYDPPSDPRISRDTTATAPVFTGHATAVTADGRSVPGPAVRIVVPRAVDPWPHQPTLAVGVPVLFRLFTGAPEAARVTGGTLPPGLSLDTHGRIYGTPTTRGEFSFWVTFRRPEGMYAWRQMRTQASLFSIDVTGSPTQVQLESMPTAHLKPKPYPVLRWRVTSTDAAGVFQYEDRVEADILTGLGTFISGIVPLRYQQSDTDGYKQTGELHMWAKGTEPIVMRVRSGRSRPYYTIIRPAGAPTSGADVWVRLDGPADVTPGQTVTLFLTGGNTGPEAATDVSVGVRLPSGVTFLKTTCNGRYAGSGQFVMPIDRLASGVTRDCTVTVRAPDGPVGGAAVVDAGIAAAGKDPITVNNTASLRVGLRAS